MYRVSIRRFCKERDRTGSESEGYGNLRVRFFKHPNSKFVESCELFYYIPTAKSVTIDTGLFKGDKGKCVRRSYRFVSGFII